MLRTLIMASAHGNNFRAQERADVQHSTFAEPYEGRTKGLR